MAVLNNVVIQLENGSTLDYNNVESLGIKLNRIVDDFNKPDSRFNEFSFSFNLPKTKNNRLHFGFADTKGVNKPFQGKELDCRVYFNSDLLLDGIISLIGFDGDSYKCVFFSKFTQLADSLKNKKLVDLTTFPTKVWEYEKSIVNHIRGTARLADEIEFPYIFYRTPFVASGSTDNNSFLSNFKSIDYTIDEFNLSEHTNYVTSSLPYGKQNPMYYSSFPVSTYLHYIVKYMLDEIGWSLSGSFFNRTDIKKIIIPFSGKPDDYAGAITTGATKYINLNKTLPDVTCSDFLKSVINTFNLYMIVDNETKSIRFETFNDIVSSNVDAIDLTNKIDKSSIVISKPEVETKISFEDDGNNNQVGGFGRIFDYSKVIANELNPTYTIQTSNFFRSRIALNKLTVSYKKNAFENLYNKTAGDKSIDLKFAACNYFPHTIVNDRNVINQSTNNAKYALAFTVSVPLLSEQTATDNKGYPFAEDVETNYAVGNSISNWTYETGLKMLYYYGQCPYNFGITGSTKTYYKDWVWVGIATGGTATVPTFARVIVPVASPYALLSTPKFEVLKANLSSFTDTDKASEVGAEAQMLLQTYFSCGTTGNTHTSTSFSLTFSDSPDLFADNLYTTFHKKKYDTIRDGYQLEADLFCDSNTWRKLQINTAILYDNEYYQLVALKSYNPVNRSAKITMLKKV